MLVAIVGTLFEPHISLWLSLDHDRHGDRRCVRRLAGLTIPMTAVPQRTAFSHSLGPCATMIGVAEYLLTLNVPPRHHG